MNNGQTAAPPGGRYPFRREIPLPRFYFDVWEGDRLARDDDGLELASLEAAERETTHGAVEIGHERLPKGCSEVSVQVRDEHGERVLTVMVSMTVRREACALAYA